MYSYYPIQQLTGTSISINLYRIGTVLHLYHISHVEIHTKTLCHTLFPQLNTHAVNPTAHFPTPLSLSAGAQPEGYAANMPPPGG